MGREFEKTECQILAVPFSLRLVRSHSMQNAIEIEIAPEPPIAPATLNEPPAPSRSFGQIIKNVLVNWTAFAITLLSGFWMMPFLINHLGEAQYAVWLIVGSLVGYLGLLDFGITQSTVKYIAEHRARGDQAAINRVITSGLSVFSVVGAFSLLASAVLALSFNRIFKTQLPDQTVAIVVALVGLNVAMTFPASVFLGVLRGYQRYDIGATAMSVSILTRCAVIYWAISSGQGIVALALTTLIFDTLRLTYITVRVFQLNPDIRVGRAHFQTSELQKLFGHSMWLFLIMVGDQINFATDTVIIGYFLAPVVLTVYAIAGRLVGYLRALVVEMVGVLMPAVSGLHAQDDAAGVEQLLIGGAKWTALLALPPAAVFWILGERFVELWIGPKYAPDAAHLLAILTLGVLAHLAEMTVTTVLVGTGRAQVVARWVIAQSLVNLALSLILVRFYGATGVALGTSISMVLFALASIPIYLRFHLQLSPRKFVQGALLTPLAAQIPFAGALWLLRTLVPTANLAAFFGAILLVVPIYGATVFALCLSSAERVGILGRLKLKKGTGVARV